MRPRDGPSSCSIEIERPEIENYLKAKARFRHDSSNLKTDYLRNKIRLELVPLLESLQPQLVRLLSQTAGILRDEDDYMTQIAEAWLAGNTEMSPQHASSVPIASFLSLPLALRRRVTRRAIEKAKKDLRRISWDHIEAIQRLTEAQKPQAALNLPGRLLVTRTYDHLIFASSAKKKPQPFHYILDGCGKYDLQEIGLSLSIEEIRNRKGLRLRGYKESFSRRRQASLSSHPANLQSRGPVHPFRHERAQEAEGFLRRSQSALGATLLNPHPVL
jgi:tRNA(Ile)-lysidine synthase